MNGGFESSFPPRVKEQEKSGGSRAAMKELGPSVTSYCWDTMNMGVQVCQVLKGEVEGRSQYAPSREKGRHLTKGKMLETFVN